jgi:hypothetical protein
MKKTLDEHNNTQRDNKISPYYSCFPTSMAMASEYLLSLQKLTRADIGCQDGELADFYNQKLDDDNTTEYVKSLGKNYQYLLTVTRREQPELEEFIFNRFMTSVGWNAKSKKISYAEYCKEIDAGIPVVLGGNFSSVCRIGGHIVCGIGYDDEKKTVIVNDPYGSALKGYPNNVGIEQATKDGEAVEYPLTFFRNGVQMSAITFFRV